jgi:hypothetical protein
MVIGLDAIGIDMPHQSTDLAAGTRGDRHGRNGVGRSPSALRPMAARTAQQPDLILAAAWVGGSVEGCPWRWFGDP